MKTIVVFLILLTSVISNGLLSVGMTIPFAKYFSVAPMIAYSFPLCSAADNMLKVTSMSNDATQLFGGITLSMAF